MTYIDIRTSIRRATLGIAVLAISSTANLAEPLSFAVPIDLGPAEQIIPHQGAVALEPAETAPELRRTVVNYPTSEAPGTVIIDTPNTYLYLVLGGGRAMRYGIGVGREGFTWSGVRAVERKTEWPDWTPPAEMLERQPYLPRFMAGGPGNPLGARAMYLSGTLYRIHGTNDPSTIGKRVSSGCIRLVNEDVIDLYSRVSLNAKVVVLPMHSVLSGKFEHRSASRADKSTVSVASRARAIY